MEVKQVAALPERLEVTDAEMSKDMFTITAVSLQAHPACPLCGELATRVHSYYTRKVADLPMGGLGGFSWIDVLLTFAPGCNAILVHNTFDSVLARVKQGCKLPVTHRIVPLVQRFKMNFLR
ncbi:hypothetical protein KSF_001800 [Reticulibacter mediterranei]|uniref:Transposase IS204/IS1001/IS1096/IS1165 zinc-finger domain-containing protein n=1 Tax=Reticulibacter mediterranei TaxID=2778369 RepID=A0A8J3IEH9_9CHLR|nr:transposase family protein [Reticulibacter mediterranei]GHO90132.1 hypothetical protein KSF_001800 [Reticulibacter mediterranei]